MQQMADGTVGGMGLETTTDVSAEIAEKIQLIKQKSIETGDILRRMEQEQEAFAIRCHDRQKLEGMLQLMAHVNDK